MIDFFLCFIISITCAYGLAVVVVEKRRDFPIRYFNVHARAFIRRYIYGKFHRLLKCTVCTSFWVALITDTTIFFISDKTYFCWPLSGFATVGITWTIIEFLNILESKQDIL